MEFTLPRSGFRMRPTLRSDGEDISEQIFGDVGVAKTLIHDVSTEGKIRAATDGWVHLLAIDSPFSHWAETGLGLWTITDPSSDDRFVGVRGLVADKAQSGDTVDTFVAVARPYWGRGVSGDSSSLLCAHVFETTQTAAICTFIWPLLNTRSEAVQITRGFVPTGHHSLRDSIGEARMSQILNFEIWRAGKIEKTHNANDLRGISIKLGQLSAENLISREEAAERILASLPQYLAGDAGTRGIVSAGIGAGFLNPAWAGYRLTRGAWQAAGAG